MEVASQTSYVGNLGQREAVCKLGVMRVWFTHEVVYSRRHSRLIQRWSELRAAADSQRYEKRVLVKGVRL